MGYRHYIGTLSKKRREQIKTLSVSELIEWGKQNNVGENDYVASYHLANEIYEMGKYVDDKYLEPYRSPVFTNKDTDEYFQEDHDFYIISKEGLAAIIQDYHSKIALMFNNMMREYKGEITPEEKILLECHETTSIECYLRDKVTVWDNEFAIKPYDLKDKSNNIVSSWKYEYAIFELVKIYKSIDWEKEYCVITAW